MSRMTRLRSGTTLLELIIAVTILAMVIAAVFRVVSSGQKTATTVMQSHQVNEEVQSAIDRISDDIKEANLVMEIGADVPPAIDWTTTDPFEDAVKAKRTDGTLKTDGPKNRLMLMKATPATVTDAGTMVIKMGMNLASITYVFEKDSDSPDLFHLIRYYEELDCDRNPKAGTSRVKTLIHDINIQKDYFLFFRIGNSNGRISARNIFCTADLARKEKKPDGTYDNNKTLFHANVLTALHIRGSAPN